MACDADRSLAPVYREALRLQAKGCDDAEIAAALDVTIEAVPALLQLAERKLRRTRGQDETTDR